MLNWKQTVALWVGIGICVVMGLIPPWKITFHAQRYTVERPVGYGFLLLPPCEGRGTCNVGLDFSRLLLQWMLVGLVVGGLVLTWKERKGPS